MEGLETIAMAAAAQLKDMAHSSRAATMPRPALPPRRSFQTTTTTTTTASPRVVSIDDSTTLNCISHDDEDHEEELLLSRMTQAFNTKFDNNNMSCPPDPKQVITTVQDTDVLLGRGGVSNNHTGNVHYRSLVKEMQVLYLKSKRRDKPRIARYIVETIRQSGGRFLKKNDDTNTWHDVGNTKAREKTSQALREGAPDLRGEPTNKKKTKRANNKQEQDPHVSGSPTTTSALCCTVSSTDEEEHPLSDTSTEPPSPKRVCRGPRLQIFKSRLSLSSS